MSFNSLCDKKRYVQKELRYAREISLEKPEETIFLIPLRLDECEVPRWLRFYQWVDYFRENKSEVYKALIASLKLRYEQKMKVEEAERERAKRKIQPQSIDFTRKVCEDIVLTYQDIPSLSRSHGLRIMVENKNLQSVICKAFLVTAYSPDESIRKYLLTNNFWVNDSSNLVIERRIDKNRIGTFLLANINKDGSAHEYLFFVMQDKAKEFVKRFRGMRKYSLTCEIQGTMGDVEFTYPVIDTAFEVSLNKRNPRFIRTTRANNPKGV